MIVAIITARKGNKNLKIKYKIIKKMPLYVGNKNIKKKIFLIRLWFSDHPDILKNAKKYEDLTLLEKI